MSSYSARLGPGVPERIEALYADALADLDRRLKGLDPFPISDLNFADDEHLLKFVSASFAAGIYGNGCAILELYRADLGRQLPQIVRSQFEAVIKLEYCLHFRRKRRDFVDAEPFVRWMTARGKALRPELSEGIVRDCLTVLRLRPDLLREERLRAEILAGKMPLPDRVYKRIADKLDFDDVASMMAQLEKAAPGWTTDLYATIYRVGSLGIHHSVGFLRDIFTDGGDGVIRFSADQHYEGAPDYLLQSSCYLIGVAGKLSGIFGADVSNPSDPLHVILAQQQEIARELKDKGLM
jgi:hypothetical protein